MKVSNFIDIKLFLISLSLTIAFLYVKSDNNIVLRKKYINNINTLNIDE
jgi:hypothetical protein